MLVTFILAVSLLLQIAAACFALRLIRISGRRLAWSLVAAAITLMAVRRGISLADILTSSSAKRPDLAVESIALAISALMAAGIERITPIFRAINSVTAELRENESRYRALFEYLPDAIFIADLDSGLIVEANPQASKLVGRPRSELLGMHQSQLHPATISDEVRASFRRHTDEAMAGLVSGPFEHIVQHADGRQIAVEITTQRVNFAGKAHVQGVFRNISERKAAEEALRRREDFSHSLLRLSRRLEQATSTGEAVAAAQDEVAAMLGYGFLVAYLLSDDGAAFRVVDRAGTLSAGIDEVSAILPIAGDPLLEEIARSKTIVVVDDARTDPRTDKSIVERLELRTLINVPIFLSDRHLGTVSTGTHGDQGVRKPSPSEEEFLTAMASHMAVTFDRMRLLEERSRAEEALRSHKAHLEEIVAQRTEELRQARDAAEAANQAKSVFLANMSHEIRTPLHSITGMARLIRRSGVAPDQAERLERIDAASKHLLSVINDILDLSKIEAGKFQLEEAELSVGAIVDNVCSMIAERAGTKGLAVRVECGALPPRLIGDATHLRQALLNYASNAVKFTQAGSVTLRAAIVGESADEVTVRFEVEDSGIGISAELLPKLFSPFEQGETSLTRQFGGTGLGLAITRMIAGLMGGEAGATSMPGSGSTFWFTARLRKSGARIEADENLPTESPEAVLKRDYAALRILIADDDPDNRYITQHLLKDVWPRVDLAGDGVQAVEQASRNTYDMILMDMRMPRMDGLEATRRIRQLPGGQAPLILALTANVFPEDKARCLDAGMNDLIPKATGAEAPFAVILRWLSNTKRAAQRREN